MQPIKEVRFIIIHHSQRDFDFPEFIRFRHKNIRGWEDIGYHYLIGDADNPHVENGRLYLGRSEKFWGAHALGFNQNSIGVCFLGNLDNKPPTKEQIKTLVEFLKCKIKEHNIDVENVLGHFELPEVEKTCPGKFLNMGGIKSMLNSI
ncbi:peptidoglycan recognition family protein [Nanoarchaeota archaeon]